MSPEKKVLSFVVYATLTLACMSAVTSVLNLDQIENVNIFADIINRPKKEMLKPRMVDLDDQATAGKDKHAAPPVKAVTIDMYQRPKLIMNFGRDSSLPALPRFCAQVAALHQGKKRKIRIAWMGDSLIEGDLITQTVRRYLQQRYGGYGAGFVSANSISNLSRSSVTHKWTGSWKDQSFKSGKTDAPLFLSGHVFFTDNGTLSIRDNTLDSSAGNVYKYLLCGAPLSGSSNVNFAVNGTEHTYDLNKPLNHILLDSSHSRSIELKVTNDQVPVYGISTESRDGIILDNFSFRGISGVELAKLDTNFLRTLNSTGYYDLVVLNYGVNVLYKPNDTSFEWYLRKMNTVIKPVIRNLSQSDVLIIGASDRGFKYGESWQSAIGMENLVSGQAELAKANHVAFLNLYATMGGENAIVNWVNAEPALANKDYVHPNHKGAEKLGELIGEAMDKDIGKSHH